MANVLPTLAVDDVKELVPGVAYGIADGGYERLITAAQEDISSTLSSYANDSRHQLLLVNLIKLLAVPEKDFQVRRVALFRPFMSGTRIGTGVTPGSGGGNGSGDGLNQAQVDARVRALVADWSEADNSEEIPASKLGNAPGGTPIPARTAGTGLTLTGNELSVTNPFTDADESKLDGIAEGAQVNPPRAGAFTAADETKLDGIAAGAEVNVKSDWNATSGDAEILNKPDLSKHTQQQDIIPFIPDDSLDVLWASSLQGNAYKEAIVTSGNTPPSGQPSGITDAVVVEWHISSSDATTRRAILAKYVGEMPLFRAKRGNDYIIARAALVEENSTAQATYFWFNPSTDENETLAYDQLPNGTGTFDLIAGDGRFVLKDGTNVTDALRTAIQGINESETLAGTFTRKANSVATQEYYISGSTIFINVTKDSSNDTALTETTHITSWIDVGSWRIRPTGNISRSVVGNVSTFTFNFTAISGTMPAIDTSSSITVEGADVHRGELTTASFRDNLPNQAHYYLRTTGGGNPNVVTEAPLTTLGTDVTEKKMAMAGAIVAAIAAAAYSGPELIAERDDLTNEGTGYKDLYSTGTTTVHTFADNDVLTFVAWETAGEGKTVTFGPIKFSDLRGGTDRVWLNFPVSGNRFQIRRNGASGNANKQLEASTAGGGTWSSTNKMQVWKWN